MDTQIISEPSPAAPRSRGTRHPLVVALGALYAAFTIVAFAAWVVVGDTWWTQPVNLLTFWWALPAVPIVLIALVTGHRRLATFLLVPAAVWLWSFGTAFLPPGTPAEAAAGADLRVATYNTYVRAAGADHVLDLVRSHRPDVLLLQEVFDDRRAELKARLSERYPYVHAVESEGVGAVMVLSRFPIRRVEEVGDPSSRSRSTAVVTIDVRGRDIQVVPVHLISPCPTCGTSFLERLELEGAVRRAEMDAVLEALDPDVPAIVGGDFNSTDRSAPYRTLVTAGFGDPQRQAGSGMGFTWPNGGPVPVVLRIDWVLVRGLDAVSAFVPEGGTSDHRPVVVDLVLPED